MADFSINDTTRRVLATGNGSTTSFSFSFQVNAVTDIKVYVDGTLRTQGSGSTNYAVQNGSGGAGLSNTGTGAVVFVTAPSNNTTVTILSDIPLSRSSLYTSGGNVTASALENDFDTITMALGDAEERDFRTIKAPVQDPIDINMTLPAKASRLGKILGFNETTGNPEVSASLTAVQSLADVTTAINLLGTSDVVTDMGLLGTSANVTAMGLLGTSSNVTAMGLLGTSAVVADMALLGVSDVIADMALLADTDVIADMNTLATSDIISDLNTLATSDIVTDMNLLATSDNVTAMGILGTSSNVTAMGLLGTSTVVEDMGLLGTSANVTAMGLLATSANVTAMGLLGTSAVVEDLGLLATSAVIEDMGLLATSAVIEDMGILGTSANVTAMANVSGSIANVNTVASNLASVNNFGEVYRIASSAPTTSLDLGDLYFDTTSDTLKVYGASGWQNAGSSVNGTSQRYHYDITGTPTSVTGADANGNTLAYDAGYVDVYVNGVRMSTADVTVTSGDTVTFASALANGDEVDIVGYGTFSVATLNADNLNSGTVPSARVTGAYTGITSVGTLTSFASTGIDDNASSTAMTLDSSNNLLVGKTATNFGTAGIELNQNGVAGKSFFARSGGEPISLNRLSSDGDILTFYKDSSLVGSIGKEGTYGSGLQILGSNSRGFIIVNPNTSVNEIIPNVDTVGKLGNSSNRWADLYLSGGAYIGGTGSANYLDDYEEGSFTPTFSGSGGPTHSAQHGKYTKIGNRVIAHLYIAINSKNTMSGTQQIAGLPFASQSDSNNYNTCSIWMGAMDSTGIFNGNQAREAFLGPNLTKIRIYAASNGSVTQLDASHMANTTDVMLAVSYDVA